ncbi:hypothetical protein F7725_008392 [Dissostichus mawsoni]|uniref:Uncharacterized protein n=1 Tax=Dissostichus mawsoni TaxID=36200 RepID=A0A7J5Y8Z8_DISMA|nr:hypothetical protein F7725_008392 [Dissostichus mawsoni]
MDRRSPQNNRGNPRPFDHGAEADRAYRQVHCRNGQINGLDEYRGAFQEERTKFCHSMRKQKDKVKRLEELLSYRDSGLHKENKRLVGTIMEREAEISRLNENIEDAELQHKRQLEDTVAWYETQKQKLSDQHNEANLVTLNLLQRREEQLLQCEEKFTKSLAKNTLTWESEKQEMEMKLKEMEAQLKRQEEKFSKDLADKNHIWETEKQQMETTLNEVTQEKNDMAKVTLTLETEFKQVEAKLKQVEKEKNRLAENNLSWETDVKQLKEQMREQEEKFSKDLAEKQLNWEQFCPTQGDGCQAVGKPIGRAEEEALQRPVPEPGELGVQG